MNEHSYSIQSTQIGRDRHNKLNEKAFVEKGAFLISQGFQYNSLDLIPHYQSAFSQFQEKLRRMPEWGKMEIDNYNFLYRVQPL